MDTIDNFRDRLRATGSPIQPEPVSRLKTASPPVAKHHRTRPQFVKSTLKNSRKTWRLSKPYVLKTGRTAAKISKATYHQGMAHKRFAAIVVLLAGLGIFAVIRLSGRPAAAVEAPIDTTYQANTSGVLEKGTPDYKTYAPSGESVSKRGGWTRVSPPNKNPVYAYIDQINGIDISVSQQPVPATFQPDVDDQLAELAKNFGASQKFSASNATVYIGTSAKGPQSLLLIKAQTLILVKSSAPLSTAQWTEYLNQLK